jgi:hypothetical protein
LLFYSILSNFSPSTATTASPIAAVPYQCSSSLKLGTSTANSYSHVAAHYLKNSILQQLVAVKKTKRLKVIISLSTLLY